MSLNKYNGSGSVLSVPITNGTPLVISLGSLTRFFIFIASIGSDLSMEYSVDGGVSYNTLYICEASDYTVPNNVINIGSEGVFCYNKHQMATHIRVTASPYVSASSLRIVKFA